MNLQQPYSELDYYVPSIRFLHDSRQLPVKLESSCTTVIRLFVGCFFVGHSAKTSLPIVALGKVTLSVTTTFTESRTLGIDRHSAKRSLPSVNARQKTTLDKWPSAAVIADGCYLCRAPGTGTRQSSFFAECRPSDTRQTMLCRVSILDTRQSIFFIFFSFLNQTFCGLFLHYV
jgi:hypothetical protein